MIPLRSPFVCGLHVPWNLQVIPKRANREKSNRLCPDLARRVDDPRLLVYCSAMHRLRNPTLLFAHEPV